MASRNSTRGGRFFNPGSSTTMYPPQPGLINARTVMSPQDKSIADRGTAASPMGDWSRTFTPTASRAGMQNMNTAAVRDMRTAQAPATRAVQTAQVADAREKTAAVQANAADVAKAQPNANTAPAAVAANNTKAGLNVNSPAIQGLLDRASGIQPTTATNTATPYGTGSVRFDKGTPTPSAPIVDANGTQTGVGRVDSSGQPFDINTARNNLKAAYPEAYTAGTPENLAFAAHANKFGEQSAHENAQDILAPIAANKGTTSPGEAQSRSTLPTPGSTDAQLSQQAIAANTATGPGGVVPNSTAGRVVGAVTGAGDIPGQVGNAVSSGLSSLGVSPQAQQNALTAGKDFVTAPIQGAKDIASGAGDLFNSFRDHVASFFTPSASPTASSTAPASSPQGPAFVPQAKPEE